MLMPFCYSIILFSEIYKSYESPGDFSITALRINYYSQLEEVIQKICFLKCYQLYLHSILDKIHLNYCNSLQY